MINIQENDGKICGHTRFTLHLGDLFLDSRYFNTKTTYQNCEERLSGAPRILENISDDLRKCKGEFNVTDETFTRIIEKASQRIILEVKNKFPLWASQMIPYAIEVERSIQSIAREQKALAIDAIKSGHVDDYLGVKQLCMFDDFDHEVYLKTTDIEWQATQDGGLHWFKFGNAKDSIARYKDEQVSLNQKLTFGRIKKISKSRSREFERSMKSIIVQNAFESLESNKKEKFKTTAKNAIKAFDAALKSSSF